MKGPRNKVRNEGGVTEVKPKRQYVQAPVVIDPGIPCPHCGNRYDNRVTNTWEPIGHRRMVCAKCGKPFPSKRLEVAQHL